MFSNKVSVCSFSVKQGERSRETHNGMNGCEGNFSDRCTAAVQGYGKHIRIRCIIKRVCKRRSGIHDVSGFSGALNAVKMTERGIGKWRKEIRINLFSCSYAAPLRCRYVPCKRKEVCSDYGHHVRMVCFMGFPDNAYGFGGKILLAAQKRIIGKKISFG